MLQEKRNPRRAAATGKKLRGITHDVACTRSAIGLYVSRRSRGGSEVEPAFIFYRYRNIEDGYILVQLCWKLICGYFWIPNPNRTAHKIHLST